MLRRRLVGVLATAMATAAMVLVAAPAALAAPPAFTKAFSPATIGPGSTATLTLTITNGTEPAPVEDLAFTDTLPAAVTIATPANATNTCGGTLTAPGGGPTITLTDGSVGAGVACRITVDVTSSTPGTHTNTTGDLTSTAGNSGTASADLTVSTGLPGFSKAFASGTVDLGERSTLTLTIDNTANASPVSTLTFADPLPGGLEVADPPAASTDCGHPLLPADLTAVPGTEIISMSAFGALAFPAIAAGALCTVVVDVTTTAGGALANRSDELFADAVSAGRATAALDVAVADLHVRKDFTDDPLAPGGTGTLRFHVTNFNRTDSATGIGFTDDLGAALAGLSAVGPLPAEPCGPGSSITGTDILTLSSGSLAPEATCTFDVTVLAPAGAPPGSHPNTTSPVTGTVGGTPVTGNVATELLFISEAPVLTKEFTDDPVGAGGSVTLRFTITDVTDSSGSTDIAFQDELTTVLPFPLSVTLPADGFCGPSASMSVVSAGTDRQALSMTGGSLGAGESCTFDVIVDVPSEVAAGTYTNTTGPISADVGGTSMTGATASADLVVVGGPSLRKEFTDDPIAPGDTVTLEFTLSHDALATADATGIAFTDDLTFVSGLTATGLPLADVCGPGNGTLSGSAGDTLLTFTSATLTPGETCTFSVSLLSSPTTPQGVHTNTTSEVTATVGGVAVADPSASDDLAVAHLTLTKEFTDDPVIPGGSVTLEFSLANSSPADDATGVSFTDDLDAALEGLAAAAGELPLAGCGGTLSGAAGDTVLDFSGGSVPAGTSCSFSVLLDVPGAAVPDTYRNTTAAFSATMNSTIIALRNATDGLVVVDPPTIGLTKTFIDDTVTPGSPVGLRFRLSNPSAVAITSIGFTDDLAATLGGLTATVLPAPDPCGPGSALTSSAGGTFLTFSGGALAPGGSCAFTVRLAVPGAATPGLYPNTTSTVSGDAGEPVGGPAATDHLLVVPRPERIGDLSITKADSADPIVAGTTLTYTVTVANAGPNEVEAVVTDPVPAGATLVETSGCAEDPAGAPECTLGAVPAGGSKSYTLTVLVDPGFVGTLDNAASVTTVDTDPDPSNNATSEETEVVAEADLSIGKADSADPVAAGATLTYTVTVDNLGPSDAAGVVVTDTLPGGVTLVTTSGCVEDPAGVPACTLGDIAAGDSASFTVEVLVDPSTAGPLTNEASVASATDDPEPGNDTTTEDTEIVAEADLSITKEDDVDPAVAGEPLTYTITVDNAGPSDATGVVVTDTLPAGVTLVATTGCAEDPGGVPACTLGDIPAGGSASYTIEVTVDSSSLGTITNEASVASATGDPEPGNDTATEDTEIVAEADLSIAKEDDVDPIEAGEPLTYTITVDNAGPSDATGVVVTDTLPAGVTLVATTGCAEDPGGVPACTLGDIPAGGSASYTIAVLVGELTSGTITNSAAVASATPDPDSGNNVASEDTEVGLVSADLSVTKESTHDPVQAGSTLVYLVSVTNHGPDAATGVVVTDSLPAGVTFKNTTGCAEDNDGVPTCSLGTIPAGDTVTYKVRVKVDRSTRGTITNAVVVASDVADPDPSNNTATEDNFVRRGGRGAPSAASHDAHTGLWTIHRPDGSALRFYFGNPGDVPMIGDWDCDGVDTPGLYRPADGYVYLRNSNTQGVADVRFVFGNPNDVPLGGDFDGDGCDTVSLWRPGEARVYVSNVLGSEGAGLGAAPRSFLFGNPGDQPFVTDHDDNGVDDVGVYRPATGRSYVRLSLTSGPADVEFRSEGRPELRGAFFDTD